MNTTETTNAKAGKFIATMIVVSVLLLSFFIPAKLIGLVSLPWVWALSPLWILWGLILLTLLIVVLHAAIRPD